MNELKSKYESLFSYLRDLAKLRERVTRDVADYEEAVFFHEVELRRGNFLITFKEEADRAGTEWLKYKKPVAAPARPSVPTSLQEMIDQEGLDDFRKEPQLALASRADLVPLGATQQSIVSAEFNRYVQQAWRPWAIAMVEWSRENELYKRLFTMHERARKFSEQYELLLGIGLLRFKATDRGMVRRHVAVAQAGLDFDAERGVFTLREGGDGAKLRVEIDMVQDLAVGDTDHAKAVAETAIRDLEVNEFPFTSELHGVLTAFVRTLHPEGEYHEGTEEPGLLSKAPSVYYCPAIVLRKRTSRGMVTLLSDIVAYIRSSNDLDLPILRDLVIPIAPGQRSADIEPSDKLEPPFFPKAFNAEQLEILRRSMSRDKVLVQGPPGTGKSHTIANIVCDLLAHGKRVLVTAYTKRALAVLKGLLPDPVKPLCVNLLGNDRQSIEDLETSVQVINKKLNDFDPRQSNTKIQQLKLKLDEALRGRTEAEEALAKLRVDDLKHHAFGPGYSGTLMEISRRIAEDSSHHSWFEEEIGNYEAARQAVNLLPALLVAWKKIEAVDRASVKRRTPVGEELPTNDEFASYCLLQSELATLRTKPAGSIEAKIGLLPVGQEEPILEQSIALLESLLEAYEGISQSYSDWCATAIAECGSGRLAFWNELLRQTNRLLGPEFIGGLAELNASYEMTLGGTDARTVRAQVASLLSFIAKGGKLSGIRLLKPREIRDALAVLEVVRLNGSPCSDARKVQELWKYLELERVHVDLSALWNERFSSKSRPLMGISEFIVQRDELERIVRGAEKLAKLRKRAASELGMAALPARFSAEIVAGIRSGLEAAKRVRELRPVVPTIRAASVVLSRLTSTQAAHPIVNELESAITKEDREKYASALRKLDLVHEQKLAVEGYEQLYVLASAHFPKLASRVETGLVGAEELDIGRLQSAVDWKFAKQRVESSLGSIPYGDLHQDLSRRSKVIERLTAVTSHIIWTQFLSVNGIAHWLEIRGSR